MHTYFDYESMGCVNYHTRVPVLLEAYAGTQIVKWQGNLERQIDGLLADAEKGRNWPYADKLREFLRIWRENEITGSINREVIDILKSASDVLAVDSWDLKNFFSNLRDQLRMLIASEEELPRDMDMNANNPMAGGGGGGGRGAPPMNPEFGPQDQGPGQPTPGVDQGPGGGEGQGMGPEGQGMGPEGQGMGPEGQGMGPEGGVPAPGEETELEGGPPAPGEEPLPDEETQRRR